MCGLWKHKVTQRVKGNYLQIANYALINREEIQYKSSMKWLRPKTIFTRWIDWDDGSKSEGTLRARLLYISGPTIRSKMVSKLSGISLWPAKFNKARILLSSRWIPNWGIKIISSKNSLENLQKFQPKNFPCRINDQHKIPIIRYNANLFQFSIHEIEDDTVQIPK